MSFISVSRVAKVGGGGDSMYSLHLFYPLIYPKKRHFTFCAIECFTKLILHYLLFFLEQSWTVFQQWPHQQLGSPGKFVNL